MSVVAALAAFFFPPTVGFMSPRSWHAPGVWLTVAICLVPACLSFGQPEAAVAAIMSMMLAALAMGVTRPYPDGYMSWRHRRQMRVFRRQLRGLGRCDLAQAAASDPHPGDKRVA